MNFERIVCLVADGLGCGYTPDAKIYGDEGSDTLRHVAEYVGGIRLPHLEKIGLGNLGGVSGVAPNKNPVGYVGRMAEKSEGKDTTTGHWEISGVVTKEALATFPNGFPDELVNAFVKATGLPGVLGNIAASGTEIIKQLGEESLRTGKIILYTSADSVFQLAAHEEKFGLERLYQICETARKLTASYRIGRIIARPFVGADASSFRRTENRRDYSLPPDKNLLDLLQESGVGVHSIGKIEDIFCHRAITTGNHTGNNPDSLRASLDRLEKIKGEKGFIFTNLVDFDMLYGHRRDPKGFAASLMELDGFLPKIFSKLTPRDALIITADHGCDPTFRGTDHTREYVPLVVYSPEKKGGDLGVRSSFADVAAFVREALGVKGSLPGLGESFLCNLKS